MKENDVSDLVMAGSALGLNEDGLKETAERLGLTEEDAEVAHKMLNDPTEE